MEKTRKITLPTWLTIIRMILVVPFLILFMLGWNIAQDTAGCNCVSEVCPTVVCNYEAFVGYYAAALVIFIVAALTDKIDGAYARKHNQVTDLGKFLDPLADKMLVDTAFVCLMMVGVMPVWAFVIIIWRDLAVDGMRMMLAQKQIVLAASVLGKIKTVVQMLALIFLILSLIFVSTVAIRTIGYILLFAAVILTVISGIEILVKGFRKLNQNQNQNQE